LWRKAGGDIESSDHRMFKIKNATKYKELFTQFELDKPFIFELFDIETFDAWMR
jgi:hypothetical protein